MNKTLRIFFFLVLSLPSFSALADSNKPNTSDEKIDLIVEGKLKYIISHNWGHVYNLTIEKTIKGSLTNKSVEFHLGVGCTDGNEPFEITKAPIILSFKKDGKMEYVPAGCGGFIDSSGTLWRLIK